MRQERGPTGGRWAVSQQPRCLQRCITSHRCRPQPVTRYACRQERTAGKEM